MSAADARAHARSLAAASHARDDPTGWFEQLYAEAGAGRAEVPWADGEPQPLLVDWLAGQPAGAGGRALVVGCGYGDDAEALAAAGWSVTAFDVAPSAVRAALARPGSVVDYRVADLLAPPPDWRYAFDLVVEINTLQTLIGGARREASRRLAEFVAPGGRLLVIARVREAGAPAGTMPWPLLRGEVEGLGRGRLRPTLLETVPDPGEPAVRRWRAVLQAG